jgi:hypothetical protein
MLTRLTLKFFNVICHLSIRIRLQETVKDYILQSVVGLLFLFNVATCILYKFTLFMQDLLIGIYDPLVYYTKDVVLEDWPWPRGASTPNFGGLGLGLGLEPPGLGLGFEGPGLGLMAWPWLQGFLYVINT